MEALKQFLFSFLSTIGFSVFFSSPKNSIIHTGIIGGLGWIVYFMTFNISSNKIISSFFGALTVGLLGELLARYYKKPATVYITPGIISLVPGAGTYYTMLYLVENDFSKAAYLGTQTLFIAAAIAIAIIISSTFSRSIKRVRQRD